MLRWEIMTRKEFKMAWYLQTSCPKNHAPRISTDTSKGCVVMAARVSRTDKFTTSKFGTVRNVLCLRNAEMINVFPNIAKAINATTKNFSIAAENSDRYGKSNVSEFSSIFK